jgi:hypothetical protein
VIFGRLDANDRIFNRVAFDQHLPGDGVGGCARCEQEKDAEEGYVFEGGHGGLLFLNTEFTDFTEKYLKLQTKQKTKVFIRVQKI